MPAPDSIPSAALAGIEERARLAKAWGLLKPRIVAESALDVGPLVEAVEAVLALAGPEPTDPDPYPEHPMIRVVRCDILREAITTALTGEERSDG